LIYCRHSLIFVLLEGAAGVEAGSKKVGIIFFQIALMKARAKGVLRLPPLRTSNPDPHFDRRFFIVEK